MPDEVIIVDAFSTDGTKDMINERADFYSCSYPDIPRPKIIINQTKGDIATGRNAIVDLANGDYVAMTDADCVADVNWIKELEKSVISSGTASASGSEERIDVVGGLTGVYGEGTLVDIREHNSAFVKVNGKEVDYAYQTRNVLLNKEMINMVGGFNTEYVLFEDMDIMYRIAKKGGKLVYNPNARVYHVRSPSIKGHVKHLYNDAVWSAIFHDDHPDAYGGDRAVGRMVGRTIIDEIVAISTVAGATVASGGNGKSINARLNDGAMGLLEGMWERLRS
jgi:GT2 family glycosyltransferase